MLRAYQQVICYRGDLAFYRALFGIVVLVDCKRFRMFVRLRGTVSSGAVTFDRHVDSSEIEAFVGINGRALT